MKTQTHLQREYITQTTQLNLWNHYKTNNKVILDQEHLATMQRHLPKLSMNNHNHTTLPRIGRPAQNHLNMRQHMSNMKRNINTSRQKIDWCLADPQEDESKNHRKISKSTWIWPQHMKRWCKPQERINREGGGIATDFIAKDRGCRLKNDSLSFSCLVIH